ncbi:hypothetical protein Desaci_1297 [Desulfosporosinus acidiphilus SJ4]|uniref:Uncharacterized protein n=1 Tax=Desulfosporosinus acidiphilus (strain DSM 22704 / JCM 16185 / SJ4) TaxID=646529 RepID=I4D3E9_DESAJ|nr:hypothetical protein [Desulfosporosinus acidiphilus]AFM40323.1 hypothetical protein Desaci_1297 [Desulfosporosinus acidiphilus SJ4]
MQLINREDEDEIKVVIHEFLMTSQVNSQESIPIELLKYLRKADKKIEDGLLLNELCDLIEQKLRNSNSR